MQVRPPVPAGGKINKTTGACEAPALQLGFGRVRTGFRHPHSTPLDRLQSRDERPVFNRAAEVFSASIHERPQQGLTARFQVDLRPAAGRTTCLVSVRLENDIQIQSSWKFRHFQSGRQRHRKSRCSSVPLRSNGRGTGPATEVIWSTLSLISLIQKTRMTCGT